MKKIIAFFLAVVLSLSLMACGTPVPLPVVEDDEDTQQEEWNVIDFTDDDQDDEKDGQKGKSEKNGDKGKKDKELDENGKYYSKEDVALYIHTYGHLPKNFITKKDAQKKGWSGGSLESYAPGCCIGGSFFGNYEGVLPEAKGRSYTECDIDTKGKNSRGAKRIVFSNDGLIFYTDDHYETFELLYGEVNG